MSSHKEDLPYWLVNVPEDQKPDKCPDFLLNVSDKDRGILLTPDRDYHRLSWPEVRKTIEDNRIDLFQRQPSDLRRYLDYNYKLKQEHGSVMDYVVSERLRWTDQNSSGPPFSNLDDIKILYNDWPYGIDERIVHLVVWTKFDLVEDPETDDLTDKARKEIADYVHQTFGGNIDSDNLIWFKNWKSLKSIKAVEHFHVMLFDPDLDFIKKITNNDIPLSQKAALTKDD